MGIIRAIAKMDVDSILDYFEEQGWEIPIMKNTVLSWAHKKRILMRDVFPFHLVEESYKWLAEHGYLEVRK